MTFHERKKSKRVFSRKKKFQNFFGRNAKEDRGKTKTSKKPGKKRLKSRKRVRKNKKIKSGGSVQSATRGEWLRARQVALIVARLPKERSLTSCSHRREGTSTSDEQRGWEELYITTRGCTAQLIPFSAFWLRSSVVSVLISLISDTSSMRGLYIKRIFGRGSWTRSLLPPLRASSRYGSTSGHGAPPPGGMWRGERREGRRGGGVGRAGGGWRCVPRGGAVGFAARRCVRLR